MWRSETTCVVDSTLTHRETGPERMNTRLGCSIPRSIGLELAPVTVSPDHLILTETLMRPIRGPDSPCISEVKDDLARHIPERD